jgi:uncharacterized membrane protein
MARGARIACQVLLVAGIVAYQVLVHLGLTGSPDPARTVLVMLPLIALGAWLLLRSPNRVVWVVILAAAAGMIFLLAQGTGLGASALYGVPHAAAYLFMLWLFGRTLRRGREPIITRLARLGRGGTLPPAMEPYTRGLTLAWCVFFAVQLAASALLLRFASVESWSLFINVLNFPLLILMFTVDYLYRVIRFRGSPQSSIATAIQAYAKDRASSLLPR